MTKTKYVLRYISPEAAVKYNAQSRTGIVVCPFCDTDCKSGKIVVTWDGMDGSGVLGGEHAYGNIGLGCETCKSEWTEHVQIRNLGIVQEGSDLNRPDMLPEDIQAMEKAGWKWIDNEWSKG